MVRSVVDRKRVLLSVQGEFTAGDTVCIAPRSLTGTRTVGDIVCRVFIADNYISQRAVAVRNNNGVDAGAERRQDNGSTPGICQGV